MQTRSRLTGQVGAFPSPHPFEMSYQRIVTFQLAGWLLAGEWNTDQLRRRLQQSLGEMPAWGPGLVERVHAFFEPGCHNVDCRDIARFIADDPAFQHAWSQSREKVRVLRYSLAPPTQPQARFRCDIPPIANPEALRRWLNLSTDRLDGYADLRGMERTASTPALRHYHYRWLKKRNGGQRLLEIPKSRTRDVQRQIYLAILARIPPHQACHGFRRGRSCLSFARPHAGKRVLIRMDLENFFTSVAGARIHALFTSVGYRRSVARRLTGLCTNRVPGTVLAENHQLSWRARRCYRDPHLPQGAPSSPALANLCAFGFDLRLNALAHSLNAVYTRYADDLAFSGDAQLEKAADRFHVLVCHIADDEGFRLNTRKTRVLRQGVSQTMVGITLNRHTNIPRIEYDRFKAILHNCIRYGPATQNRDNHPNFRAHLQGRIAHLNNINPHRAARLRALFAKIKW